jgi:hypothetical protein
MINNQKYPVLYMNKLKSLTQLISECKNVHGDKYDYSRVVYKGTHVKVTIVCYVHGEFKQAPVSHISLRQGCPQCYGNKKKTTVDFIRDAIEVHRTKYSYDFVDYKNSDTKVTIVCPLHGKFDQTPKNHIIRKSGCPWCVNRARLSTEQFVVRAQTIHSYDFDYSQVVYQNMTTPVVIICPFHGPWKTLPTIHLHSNTGCPICSTSKGEKRIRAFLESNNIKFIPQYSPKDLTNITKKAHYRYDFYLPDHNILVEFDGLQHQKFVQRWHKTEEGFVRSKQRDTIKTQYAASKNIQLIRIPYKNMDMIDQILTEELL